MKVEKWIDVPSGVAIEVAPGVWIMQITNEVMPVAVTVETVDPLSNDDS